jgi:hypothetical protein
MICFEHRKDSVAPPNTLTGKNLMQNQKKRCLGRLSLLAGLVLFGFFFLVNGALPDTSESELELARENLRISEATEARIASQLAQIKKSGEASPEIIKDYETYLGRVQEMVLENRKIVREMERRYAKLTRPLESAESSSSTHSGDLQDLDLPSEEKYDEVAALDHEFNESLAAFDEMLLKELDEIRASSADKMTDLAQEAAAAAKRLREKGVALNTSSEEASNNGEGGEQCSGEKTNGSEEGTTERKHGAMGQEEGDMGSEEGGSYAEPLETDPSSASRESASVGQGKGRGPKHKDRRSSDAYDDDIVARQLREAAEKETDPELKEKLWKEYEDYKSGSSQ